MPLPSLLRVATLLPVLGLAACTHPGFPGMPIGSWVTPADTLTACDAYRPTARDWCERLRPGEPFILTGRDSDTVAIVRRPAGGRWLGLDARQLRPAHTTWRPKAP